MKRYVTWEEAEQFVRAVAEKWPEGSVCGVYSPPRGGLLLGVMYSHLTGAPMLLHPCDGCLIIDDIADTGVTLQRFAGIYPIATMFYAAQCVFEPDFWMFEKDAWVVYPWEMGDLS